MMDKENEKSNIQLINKNYLRNEDANEEQFRVRLKQTAYDNDNYKNIVEGSIISNESSLVSNYLEFKKMIKDSDLTAIDIFNGLSKLEMVWVKLEIQESNLEDIQLIFEKINSTGEPLTCADLLRNYLLISNSSKEQEKLYFNYWVKIEGILTEEYISDFVEDYLKMKICNFLNDDEIYEEFKVYVENNHLSREDVLKDIAYGIGPQENLVALGYCSWKPGQLEREILNNDWLVAEASNEILFHTEDEFKWERALDETKVDLERFVLTTGHA